jgi:hypothetical protein
MKNSDREKELLEIEMRKLKGKLSYEEAILSKERLAEKNKKMASGIKREKETLKEIALNTQIAEEKKIKETVEKINKGRLNNKIIQSEIQIQKQKIVKEINEKSEELVKQAVKKVKKFYKKYI